MVFAILICYVLVGGTKEPQTLTETTVIKSRSMATSATALV